MNDVLILNLARLVAAIAAFYGGFVLLSHEKKIRPLGLRLRLMVWFTSTLCFAASALDSLDRVTVVR